MRLVRGRFPRHSFHSSNQRASRTRSAMQFRWVGTPTPWRVSPEVLPRPTMGERLRTFLDRSWRCWMSVWSRWSTGLGSALGCYDKFHNVAPSSRTGKPAHLERLAPRGSRKIRLSQPPRRLVRPDLRDGPAGSTGGKAPSHNSRRRGIALPTRSRASIEIASEQQGEKSPHASSCRSRSPIQFVVPCIHGRPKGNRNC